MESSAVLNSCHQSASSTSTSPTSALSRIKLKPALNRACSTKLKGEVPNRLSKRGCIIQISRMSAPNLPRPDTSPIWASNTSSIDACKAGYDGMRCVKRCAHPSRTSAHKTLANKKLGATGLPSDTRRSVSCNAAFTNGWSARATTKSNKG